jgi:hypothetical protein
MQDRDDKRSNGTGRGDVSDSTTKCSDTTRDLRITALIPAYNEAERIAATVTAVRGIAAVDEVIVIDDGSRDDTAQLAVDAGARVMRLTKPGLVGNNVGKGGALQYAATRCEDADIVLLLDGDLGESASQAALLLEPVLAGTADMAIAAFPKPAGKAGFGLVKGLAARAIRKAARRSCAPGCDTWTPAAPLSGQRALTRACLDAVLPFGSGYGVEVALSIRALRAGFRLVEVPTTMTHAATGRDLAGFLHRGKQFRDVAVTLIKMKF